MVEHQIVQATYFFDSKLLVGLYFNFTSLLKRLLLDERNLLESQGSVCEAETQPGRRSSSRKRIIPSCSSH